MNSYHIQGIFICPVCNKISPSTGTNAEPGILCNCSKGDLQQKIVELLENGNSNSKTNK